MRLWGYYAWHTFLNSLKKMFRSTVLVVILAVFGFGVIFGVAGAAIGSIVESQQEAEISSETVAEGNSDDGTDAGENDDVEADEDEMTPEDVALIKMWVEGAIGFMILVVLLWGVYSGSKSGANIFQMADVNFLFTAPMKPQTVLMFRLSFQMLGAFAGSLYLLFQIPNLVVNLHLGVTAVIAMLVGYIMLLILQRLMVVLSYTVFSTHAQWKPYVLHIVVAIASVVLLWMGIVFLTNGRDVVAMMESTFSSEWMRYVPLIGWYKAMIMYAVEGETWAFLLYLGLLIISISILVLLIWNIKADFYEDACSAASKAAETLDDAMAGRVVTKEKKYSKRIRREGSFGGSGALVFLTKEVYVRRRMAKLGFLSNTMLFYIAACVGLAVLSVKVVKTSSFLLTGAVMLAILFFRNMGNPIEQEASKNWLYLVPDSPYKKVFFSMLSGTYSCAIDLLPALVIGGVMIGASPIRMVLWYLTMLIVDFMLSSIGMMLEALLPATAMDMVKAMIQMLLRFAIILVLVGFMLVGYLLGGEGMALVVTSVGSVVLGGLCFVIYPSILHSGVN